MWRGRTEWTRKAKEDRKEDDKPKKTKEDRKTGARQKIPKRIERRTTRTSKYQRGQKNGRQKQANIKEDRRTVDEGRVNTKEDRKTDDKDEKRPEIIGRQTRKTSKYQRG